tara:strand:- start:872 stop:1417 length:546 start_codon:yes stop_codon:yes gene_type:complete
MNININKHPTLNDVRIIKNDDFTDERGYFTKIYFEKIKKNLDFNIDEIFYSINNKGVIRGIHYQKKEKKLGKIIKCIDGEIIDFFIDLRKDSNTFGTYSSEILSKENNLSIYIPQGFGHGFSVISDKATVVYLQSGDYDFDSEGGIDPLSFNFDWKVEKPIISSRDTNHPPFDLDNKEFKL